MSIWKEVQEMLWITDPIELDLKAGLSLAYFYSHRDPYHYQVFNHLEYIEPEFSNIKFYAIEAESFPKLIKQHRALSLPFIRIFKDEGYTIKTFTWLDVLIKSATLRDIESRYNQGDLRDRRPNPSINPKAHSGNATATRTEDIGENLG
jgi:hypothetical protein